MYNYYHNYDFTNGLMTLADELFEIFDRMPNSTPYSSAVKSPSSYYYGYSFSKDIVEETDEDYKVPVMVPGVKKEDIEIIFKEIEKVQTLIVDVKEGNSFTVKGNRVFTFKKPIDKSKITSKLVDGILTITLAKDKANTYEGKVTIE